MKERFNFEQFDTLLGDAIEEAEASQVAGQLCLEAIERVLHEPERQRKAG